LTYTKIVAYAFFGYSCSFYFKVCSTTDPPQNQTTLLLQMKLHWIYIGHCFGPPSKQTENKN